MEQNHVTLTSDSFIEEKKKFSSLAELHLPNSFKNKDPEIRIFDDITEILASNKDLVDQYHDGKFQALAELYNIALTEIEMLSSKQLIWDTLIELLTKKDLFVKYPEPDQLYRHFKGGKYRILTMAKHTTTDESLVIYQSLLFGSFHARPLEEFTEVHPTKFGEKGKRFTKIKIQ